jgi:hypothetical protein
MTAQVKRVWRHQVGTLLVLYLILDWLPFVFQRAQGDLQDTPMGHAMAVFALDALLTWRIWRRGNISWVILLLICAWNLLITVTATTAPWPPSIYLFAAIGAAQLAILLSPAVRHHLRPKSRRTT